MTTTTTPYGTYEHGTPQRGEAGMWHRIDKWTPGAHAHDRLFCAGPADDSPIHSGGLGCQYDAACSSCWLGYAHTQALHNREVRP